VKNFRRSIYGKFLPIVMLCTVAVAGCQGEDSSVLRDVRLVNSGPLVDAVVGQNSSLLATDGRDVFDIPATGNQLTARAASVPGLTTGVNMANRPVVYGLSRAVNGDVWLTLGGSDAVGGRRVIQWPNGVPHVAMPQLVALLARGSDARPTLQAPIRRLRAASAIAALDDQTLLGATLESGLSSSGDGGDCQVWRVTVKGSVPVAGRLSQVERAPSDSSSVWRAVKPRPAARLRIGERVPAAGVDLERVLSILPMPGGRVIVVTQAPIEQATSGLALGEAGLVVLVLEGSEIRRMDSSALRDDGRPPLLTGIDNKRVLLSSGQSIQADDEIKSNDRFWSVIDLETSTTRLLGSGPGLAVGGGGGYVVINSPKSNDGISTVQKIELPPEN
jgi:hypothetical protein